jgi:indolepyruvate ferredoxin oxidoreductase, beta subunit
VSEARIISLLVPAVGGQGGGVLSEWIVEAAARDGVTAHGTSIPGVAQRTGSTTYYVELYTGPAEDEPAFSLYPVPGALDVLVAPEFLEVGRMIEAGFVSPSRTTVICSTHRLYSIHEKIATGRAIYPAEDLRRAARAMSRALIAFDALALARERGTEANAILLGALAGSGVIPVGVEAFREAVAHKGVLVASNLAGFEIGLEIGRAGGLSPASRAAEAAGAGGTRAGSPRQGSARIPPAPVASATRDASVGGAFAPEVDAMPEVVRSIVERALPRLVEYQDENYARRYLDRLRPFVAAAKDDVGIETAATVARYLALWMTYEDAIRVAQLKTRPERFERIRGDVRARDATIVVTDYLKPDLDEIWGVLPRRLVAPFARWALRRWPHGRPTLGQHVRTTTVSGYLRVLSLRLLRPLRPISYRAHEEHARMERWLAVVRRCAAVDGALALEVARAGRLVKGYGDVRRRMAALLDELLATIDLLLSVEGGAVIATPLAARFRALVLQGPDGETQARAAVAATLGPLRASSRESARAPAATG